MSQIKKDMKHLYYTTILAFLVGTILSFLVGTILSCKKQKSQLIPAEIDDYVISFFQDARDNGLDIYLEDYDLSIEFTILEDATGTCTLPSNVIGIDSLAWKQITEFGKKQLIYHELGHCILGRIHDNDQQFENGECKSMMRDNTMTDCNTNFISDSWRAYYIQELFSTNDDLPDWYDLSSYPRLPDSLSYNLIEIDTTISNRLRLNDAQFEEDANFQICLTLENWQATENCIYIVWAQRDYQLCSNNKTIIRKNTGGANPRGTYYEKVQVNHQDVERLCILKEDNFYHFFVGDRLIHIMDYELLEHKNINVPMDGPINLNLTIFNF